MLFVFHHSFVEALNVFHSEFCQTQYEHSVSVLTVQQKGSEGLGDEAVFIDDNSARDLSTNY